MCILAWEPGAAHITRSYSLRLSSLVLNHDFTYFSLLKSTHSTLNLRIIPWFSRLLQSKFVANRPNSPRLMIGHQNKQTDKQRLLHVKRISSTNISPQECSENLHGVAKSFFPTLGNVIVRIHISQLVKTFSQ